MTYTTNELISDAYYQSKVVSRDMETVSGKQSEDGIRWLNEIIGKKVIGWDTIPYEKQLEFDGIIDQEKYYIPNLISIDTITYVRENVRYAMRYIGRNEYHGSPRVNNIQTLPFSYFFERTFGGADVYIYFLPDQAYPFTITGVFRLNDIVQGQDLSLTLDTFYITYLKLLLTEKICYEYGEKIPFAVAKELSDYEGLIKKQSRPLDLSLNKLSTLQHGRNTSWATVTLGRGWFPGGQNG